MSDMNIFSLRHFRTFNLVYQRRKRLLFLQNFANGSNKFKLNASTWLSFSPLWCPKIGHLQQEWKYFLSLNSKISTINMAARAAATLSKVFFRQVVHYSPPKVFHDFEKKTCTHVLLKVLYPYGRFNDLHGTYSTFF